MGFTRKRLERFLPSGAFARHVLVLGGGTAFSQGAALLVTPILTRLYTKAEMGQVGLFISLLSVSSIFVSLRYELSLPNARSDEESNALLALALGLLVPMSALCGLASAGIVARNWLSMGELPVWSGLLVALGAALMGAFTALRYWYVRKQAFGTISKYVVWQGLGRAAGSVLLGLWAPFGALLGLTWASLGWLGLAFGEIIGRWLGAERLFAGAWSSLRPFASAEGLAKVRSAARAYSRFPLVMLPSGFIEMVALALPQPLVNHFYGPAAAGVFLVVQRLSTAPGALISASVGDVFHSHAAESQRRSVSVRSLVIRTASKLALVGAAILIPAAVLAYYFAAPLLGKAWAEVGPLFVAIVPWSLAMLVMTPISRALLLTRHMPMKLLVDLLGLASLVGLLALSQNWKLGFVGAMWLVSLGQALVYSVYGLIVLFAVGRLDSRAESDQGRNDEAPCE